MRRISSRIGRSRPSSRRRRPARTGIRRRARPLPAGGRWSSARRGRPAAAAGCSRSRARNSRRTPRSLRRCRRCGSSSPDAWARYSRRPRSGRNSPVPMVKDGARCVPKPAAPWAAGRVHHHAQRLHRAGIAEDGGGIAAVDRRGMAGAGHADQSARAVEMPAWTCGTRTKPRTGQSFSLDRASSMPTRSMGVRITLAEFGTLIPTLPAISTALLPNASTLKEPRPNRYSRMSSTSSGFAT